MTRATLTIEGVPDFRYDLARKSRERYARAMAQIGHHSDDICAWELVDRLRERPDREYFWDRADRGWIDPETAFGPELVNERIPGPYGSWFTPKGGEPFYRDAFRHSVHFLRFNVYEPRTQAELDAASHKREIKAKALAESREREAAPLFLGEHV